MPRDLAPELWAKVFEHLKRPTPSMQEAKPWKALHQHDLATVSRVSSSFHELSLPYLYSDTVVVDRLPLLLGQTRDAPASLRAKITSKLDRLNLIRHLRISAMGPACSDTWDVATLLENGGFEAVWEMETAQRQRWLKLALGEYRDFGKFFDQSIRTIARRANIETIVIGQPCANPCLPLFEESFEEDATMDAMWDAFDAHTGGCFAQYIIDLSARHVCTYLADGPYILQSLSSRPADSKFTPVLSVHHHDNQTFWPMIFGSQIRHFFGPGQNYVPHDFEFVSPLYWFGNGPGEAHITMLERELSVPGPRDKAQYNDYARAVAKTNVSIYGMFAPTQEPRINIHSLWRSYYSHSHEYDPQIVIAHSRTGEDRQGGYEDTNRIMEHSRLNKFAPLYIDRLPHDWRDKVTFYRWEETPTCEACGVKGSGSKEG